MAIGVFTILAGLIALAGAYLYFFGLAPETKRKLEHQALKTMGENKMSYMAKDSINKIPTSDQDDLQQLKKGISNLAGGAMQNPIGEQAVRAATQVWDSAQGLTKAASERVDWDTVQGYSQGMLERVSTMTNRSKNQAKKTVEITTKKTE